MQFVTPDSVNDNEKIVLTKYNDIEANNSEDTMTGNNILAEEHDNKRVHDIYETEPTIAKPEFSEP